MKTTKAFRVLVAAATFLFSSPYPLLAADKEVALSSLSLDTAKQGWGTPGIDRSVGNRSLTISGQKFSNGFGTHATSKLIVDLNGGCTRFTAYVGINDEGGSEGSSEFIVIGDERVLWRSPVMRHGMAAQRVDVDLKGVQQLQLLVTDAGDGINGDHANWANAMLHVNGSMPVCKEASRWTLDKEESITWFVKNDPNLPHSDFIEQGGRRVGQIVRYSVSAAGLLTVKRDVVWPSLRIHPNDTHGSLIHHYSTEAEPKITVDSSPLDPIKVSEVKLDGTVVFIGEANGLLVRRVTFPSFEKYVTIDNWTLKNNGAKAVSISVAPIVLSSEKDGPYGKNLMEVRSDAIEKRKLEPGQSLTFSIYFSARSIDSAPESHNGVQEEKIRRSFIESLSLSLRLETPDPILNRAFTFAKWRAAEAINDTKGGMMLAPGNLRYYAASWCNDNVEYAGPFFPFLGDNGGISGSLNVYRHYMPYMKNDYTRIPCSIIAEGTSTWGPFDRGDAAMYAYGASRFCLALGDKEIAEELWKAIEWTLEYCKRKINEDGVVASDTDELEGRLPTGKANLNTSSLYYGGLRSAANLARALDKIELANSYDSQADKMRVAIEKYFGATVEGFETYKYYKENVVLRSWICTPLSMGILNRAQGTLDALFSPKMWTPDGLASRSGDKVFWDRSTLYAFRSAFQAGDTIKALDFLKKYTTRRLLGDHVPYAVEAYPEGGQAHLSSESALYCRVFVEGLFGILPIGLDEFKCTPRIPDEWEGMALRRVKAFKRDFDIVIKRADSKLQLQIIQNNRVTYQKQFVSGETIKVKF